ncbi:MAG: SGNH/GDSL hydrolase family protein [Lachnospiraceae bacterium]|nr:SGNH/GDSL hydrolase family protein [Lachnospiraceae bacterium]
MRYNKRWKLTVGAFMTVVICTCAGCGKEEDSQPAEQRNEQEKEAADLPEVSETEMQMKTDAKLPEETEPAEPENGEEETLNERETSGLEGITVSIHGDSISTFENWIPYGYNNFYPMSGEVNDINDTWWIRMFDNTGMKLCANASSAGCTCAGDSTDAEDPQVGCDDFRITDLSDKNGTYPDIIVVFMGTNDLLTNVMLGDNDGTSAVEEGFIDNFSDAYSLMLDKLENYYPCTDIYCCTLLQVGDYGTDTPYVAFTNEQGLTAEDYTNRIRTIAQNKGYSVVDLYHCGIEIDNLQNMTSDGVHPNAEGMWYIAEAVTDTIMSQYSR